MIEKVEVWKCRCDNCEHEWISTMESVPTHCPKKGCSNPTKWNSGGTKQKRKGITMSKPVSKDQTGWKVYNANNPKTSVTVDLKGNVIDDSEREIIPIDET